MKSFDESKESYTGSCKWNASPGHPQEAQSKLPMAFSVFMLTVISCKNLQMVSLPLLLTFQKDACNQVYVIDPRLDETDMHEYTD